MQINLGTNVMNSRDDKMCGFIQESEYIVWFDFGVDLDGNLNDPELSHVSFVDGDAAISRKLYEIQSCYRTLAVGGNHLIIFCTCIR